MFLPNVHSFLDGVMGVTVVLLMVHETNNKTTVAPITPSRNACTFSKTDVPFLVGSVICLVISVYDRDLCLPISVKCNFSLITSLRVTVCV